MYSFEGRVRYSETDSDERLTLLSILNYFQDCSTFQSEDLGVGLDVLKAREEFWVLNYWQIDVMRYPRLCEKITIGTHAYECRGILGYRNFYMDDADGQRIAIANTLWTYLSMKNGMPARIPEQVITAFGHDEKLEMEYEPRKIHISPEIQGEKAEAFEVKPLHLDANHHVNNGQYVLMASEYLQQGFRIDRMRAEYRKAALLNDTIYPIIYRSEKYTAVSLNQSDGKPYAIVEFRCLR